MRRSTTRAFLGAVLLIAALAAASCQAKSSQAPAAPDAETPRPTTGADAAVLPDAAPPTPPDAGRGAGPLEPFAGDFAVGDGELDTVALAKLIRQRKAPLVGCYKRALDRHPQLSGKVVMRFTVTPEGKASNVEAEELGMAGAGVGECMARVMRGWSFPLRPAASVRVQFPFVFSSPD